MPFATAGTGSGSGYYNVTALHPLRTGYYTKATAVAKLAEADIDDDHKRGMIITFESAAGKWEDYRFIGTSLSTFTNPGAWEEYGSKNTVRSITVNGEKTHSAMRSALSWCRRILRRRPRQPVC